MKTPQGGTGWYDRVAQYLYRFYQQTWVKNFVGPLLIAAPPGLVTAFYANQAFRAGVTNNLPPVAEFLTENALWVVVVSAFYTPFLLAVARSILHRVDAKSITVNTLLRLNQALDRVVGCKEQRFSNHANRVAQLTKDTAFCTITQPDSQIAELVRGICEFFNAERGDDSTTLIKVILAELRNGQVTKIPVHYPEDEPVRASLDKLNDTRSGILTACKTCEVVVIESIAAELKKPRWERRFANAGNDGDNVGSLICYPVTYGSDVPFVISIHCERDGHFKDSKKKVYEHTLERFALRIRLEYSLLLMKEALCEPKPQP